MALKERFSEYYLYDFVGLIVVRDSNKCVYGLIFELSNINF